MSTTSPVLVIDDDRDVLATMEALLVESGYAVATARSGAVALELLASERPCAILLDLRMPEMDGAEFLRRARESLPEPPVVIVVSAGSEARDEAELLGAHGFVAKPFDLDDLLAALHVALGKPV